MMGSAAFACFLGFHFLVATTAQDDLTAVEVKGLKTALVGDGVVTKHARLCGFFGYKFRVTDVVGVPTNAPKALDVAMTFGPIANPYYHKVNIQLKKTNGEIVGARTSTILLKEKYWDCAGGVQWDSGNVAALEDAVAHRANFGFATKPKNDA